jgi:hypothetical protein
MPLPALLARGAAELATDPRAAAATFAGAAGDPVADAYLAYLALVAGDAARAAEAARRARENLASPARDLAGFEGAVPTITETLRVLRLALEESARAHGSDEPPLACSVFVTHAKEALSAFGAVWGSTRDIHGRDLKALCVDRFLQAMPKEDAARVQQALRALGDAMITIAPRPDGTMYFAIFILATDGMLDSLLAPEVPSSTPKLRLDDEVARAAKLEPALAVRARAFEAVLRREAPELAKGICAVLAARGRPADPVACAARASTAAKQALAHWLKGRRSVG